MSELERPLRRVEQIPIDQIHVLNPRSRNKKVHTDLIENIALVGLKRPISVSLRIGPDGGKRYELICGQGRMEALLALHQTEIAAFVIEATDEDCLVMSLVENVARRAHRPIDLMREVGSLRARGHTDGEIGKMIGVTSSWVNMIGGLLERGEEKLLTAVEAGLIPLGLATDIARSSGTEIQNLLSDAYEQGLRGKKLKSLRQLLERRAKRDNQVRSNALGAPRARRKKLTATEMRRLLEREADKQRLLAKKAAFTHDRLVFATQALKELFSIEAFAKILRAEQLDVLPKLLAGRIHATERA